MSSRFWKCSKPVRLTQDPCHRITVHPILTHLQVLVLVQDPGLEGLVRGTGHALQALRVEGEAHEGLGAGGGGLAEDRPLGHVPQQQGPVLVARQQQRRGARVWLGGWVGGRKGS